MSCSPSLPEIRSLLRLGLSQLDQEGLRTLLSHIDAGKPILLDGDVYDPDTGHG